MTNKIVELADRFEDDADRNYTMSMRKVAHLVREAAGAVEYEYASQWSTSQDGYWYTDEFGDEAYARQELKEISEMPRYVRSRLVRRAKPGPIEVIDE